MKFKDRYLESKKLADKFEGMMAPLSVAIFQSIFSAQRDADIKGDLIEYGVYKGKSAAILLNNLNSEEIAHLIDIKDYPELDKLSKISKKYKFYKGKSEDLTTENKFDKALSKPIRFSHHDASHSFINVITEMGYMENKLGPRGVLVLDDFGSPGYMQVIAACYTYLANPDCNLEVFLVGSNKAYLCRKEDFDFYAQYVVENLLSDVNGAGFECYIARTDIHPQYKAFSIAHKKTPDAPDQYGLHIYGDRFYKV